MSRVIDWVRDHRNRINTFAPWFLASYFLLLVLPYCTGRIPVLYAAVCVNIIGKVIFRLIPTAYFFIYTILVGVANKTRFRWEWVFPIVAVWIMYGLAWAFTAKEYVYVSISWNRSITYESTQVGYIELLVAFLTLIAETSMFFCWLTIIPSCIKNRKAMFVPLITIAVFAFISILFSVVYEWKLYVELFNGGDHKGIHSFFSQKNEFGAFMFMGVFSLSFLAFFSKTKISILWSLCALGVMCILLLVRCYTALMSALICLVALVLLLLVRLYRRNHAVALGVAGATLLAMTFLVLCVFLPSVRDKMPVFRVFYNSIMSTEREISTRTVIWAHLEDVINGHRLFAGVTDPISDVKTAGFQVSSDEGAVAIYHNSYLAYLSYHGLAGILLYFSVIFSIVKKVFSAWANKPMTCLFLFLLLVGYLLQGMAETYILFIKMSVLTLPLTYVFCCFLPMALEAKTNA